MTGLEAAGERVAGLQRQLDEARDAARAEVTRALASGLSFRRVAAASGLSLGAVQRLAAAAPVEAPRVTPPTPTSICVRGRCGAPATPGKRFCPRHMWD